MSLRRTPDGGVFVRVHRLCVYVRAHRGGLVLTWRVLDG